MKSSIQERVRAYDVDGRGTATVASLLHYAEDSRLALAEVLIAHGIPYPFRNLARAQTLVIEAPLPMLATFTATSFIGVAIIQRALEMGARPSVLWQVAPYVVLTVSEILVSITGLEFAYTQAPLRMKGTVMSLWLLTTFLGNFVVVLVKKLGLVHGTTEFLFWAGLTYLAALCFALIARRYVVKDHYLPDVTPVPASSPATGATARLA